MNIINMTPHTINIFNAAGEEVMKVPSSGEIARLSVKRVKTAEVDGVEFYATEFGEPSPLPEMASDVIYIVSALYASGLREKVGSRPDVFIPGEGKRNEAGQVVGCIGLSAM